MESCAYVSCCSSFSPEEKTSLSSSEELQRKSQPCLKCTRKSIKSWRAIQFLYCVFIFPKANLRQSWYLHKHKNIVTIRDGIFGLCEEWIMWCHSNLTVSQCSCQNLTSLLQLYKQTLHDQVVYPSFVFLIVKIAHTVLYLTVVFIVLQIQGIVY